MKKFIYHFLLWIILFFFADKQDKKKKIILWLNSIQSRTTFDVVLDWREFVMKELFTKEFVMIEFNMRKFNKYERIYFDIMKEFNNRVIENDIRCRFDWRKFSMKEFSMREFSMRVFSMRIFNRREFNKYERIYLLWKSLIIV
jgi:hypothetical protein